jgi:hypothetical protein
MEVPMLDEDEAKKAGELYSLAFSDRNKGVPISERFIPLLTYYNELTGFNEINHNAIMHHYVALYGPPCEKCGKPYRTPKASFCAACGNKRT